jgi:hypothetical protein
MRYALAGLALVTQSLHLFLASVLVMISSIFILMPFNRAETRCD